MQKTRKISHSMQRKRVIARQKHKLHGRRLIQFIHDNQAN